MPDTLTVCRGCMARTENRVAALPADEAELVVALARLDHLVERSDTGQSAERALAYREDAGDALREIRQFLIGWCRLLHDERRVDLPRYDTVTAMSSHLWTHLLKLQTHPAAAELVHEAKAVHDLAVKVVDLPELRMRVEVGPCPEDLDTDPPTPCPGTVVAKVPTDPAVRPTMDCRHCATVWFPEQWHRVGRRILARQGLRQQLHRAAAESLARRVTGAA